MRDAREKYVFVSQGDVIEQNQMLVNLSRVAHVRNDPQAELSRQQAYREELGNSRNPRTVRLYDLHRFRLHEVLKHDSVRNVLAQRNRDWFDPFGERAVRPNIVWVRGFFYEVRGHVSNGEAHLQRTGKRPLLVSDKH